MKPQDIKLTYENNRSIFWDIYNMPFGKERYKPDNEEITWGRLNLEFGILMGTYR